MATLRYPSAYYFLLTLTEHASFTKRLSIIQTQAPAIKDKEISRKIHLKRVKSADGILNETFELFAVICLSDIMVMNSARYEALLGLTLTYPPSFSYRD